MATITLEVSDELATRLEQMTDRLPDVLAAVLDGGALPSDAFIANPAWNEVIDFLSQAPDVQSILTFKLSDSMQDRIEELLYLGNEGSQTSQERAELDGYVQVIRFFDLLKANLRHRLP
jgi:predicted transcriptional regulator